MTDWTTARVTPEIQTELRRMLDAPAADPGRSAAVIAGIRDALPTAQP